MDKVVQPVQMWKLEENKIVLNEDALNFVSQKPEHNGKEVVIVSIIGPTRWGKSFLANFLLRFLKAADKKSWLGNPEDRLTGFSWKRSSSPVTEGVQLWTEPFVATGPSGEEVVIILMDTQGVFDRRLSFANCTKLTALCVFVSSMLIYNLQGQLMQNMFKYLQYFCDYGRGSEMSSAEETAICQQLTFLIRDWINDDEFPFGWLGGQDYLAQQMNATPDGPSEINEAWKYLRTCFNNTNCFLMPHPGSESIGESDFNGQWGRMSERFVSELNVFVKTFLFGKHLHTIKLHGQSVFWEHLPYLFQRITDSLNQSTLPEPKDIIAVTFEVKARLAVETSVDIYTAHMKQAIYSVYDALELEDFTREHQLASRMALGALYTKLGQCAYERWEIVLKEKIEDASHRFRAEFISILQESQKMFNEQLLAECLDEFIVNLPLAQKQFDPRSIVETTLRKGLRGDEDTKCKFEQRLSDKIEDLSAIYKKDRKLYRTHTNFFETWKRKVYTEQNRLGIYLSTRKWNQICCSTESELLRRLVSFVLFRVLLKEATDDQTKVIEMITSKLTALATIEDDGSVVLRFSVIFVNGLRESNCHTANYPIFRVMKGDGKSAEDSHFLDHCGRLYENWESYLAQNLLDGYCILVPEHGEYTVVDSQVQLQLKDQTKRDFAWKVTDVTMKVGGCIASSVAVLGAILTIFPLTAPVGIGLMIGGAIGSGTSAAYAGSRAIYNIVDMSKHGQSMSCKEAIVAWVELSLAIGQTVTVGFQGIVAFSNLLRVVRFVESFVPTTITTTLAIIGSTTSAFQQRDKSLPKTTEELKSFILLLTNCCVSESSEEIHLLATALMENYSALAKKSEAVDFIRELNYI